MHVGELDNFSEDGDDDHSGVSSLLTSQSKQKTKRSTKNKANTPRLPTYSWESTAENDVNNSHHGSRMTQERICTAEHGTFLPSTTPGVYLAEEEGGVDDVSTVASEVSDHLNAEKSLSGLSGYPATHLDIQVSCSRV